MNNIKTIQSKCVGCGACENICPHKAITMEKNNEGFLYPVIDTKKCVNCGICINHCPLHQSSFKPNTDLPKCYAAQSNTDIMKHSSSGGIFSVLADYVFKQGGYVCGAAFNKNWVVEHSIISDKVNLYQLQNSKYVQSDTKQVFTEIKKILIDNKTVLFSGTPCQVAGLYAFLGRDYDNLITVDIFCHGVPSPEVWKRYLSEVTGKSDKISDINFRFKSTSFSSKNDINMYFQLNSSENMILEHFSKNIYMQGFLRNLYLRKSCHCCAFTKTPRDSDFSIGDFWGYESIDKKTDTTKGLSAVLLNTTKANKIFSVLKPQLQFIKEVDLSDIIRGNPVLCRPVPEHSNRAAFFEEFSKGGHVIPMIHKNLIKKDVAILNYSSFSNTNYGALLVGYAMEKVVEKLGYKPHTVNFIPDDKFYSYSKQNNFTQFRTNFLHLTGICRSKNELYNSINQEFDKFIIGSDQIVRQPGHHDFIYYLDWVSGNKTLLSYAASFGISKLGMKKEEKKYASMCLNRFDAFSVREQSGADIMKNDFGKDHIPVICDPTMLLEADDYQNIIDHENLTAPKEEYIAYYFLDENPGILKDFEKTYTIINAYKNENGEYRTFGEWLNIIKNAKYVITDSFHGSIFSIIYRKQFITLTTKNRGNGRLESLMKILGTNRLINNNEKLTEDLFKEKIDYNSCIKNIERAKKEGYEYLKQALAIVPNTKKAIIKNNEINILLFNILPFIKITKKNKIRVYLMGIPLLKIYKKKIYLFGLIKIGRYKG